MARCTNEGKRTRNGDDEGDTSADDIKTEVEGCTYEGINFDLLTLPTHELARQISLLDLTAYNSILAEELRGCAWQGKEKFRTAPNIVNFTRRFQHLSLWVTREILTAKNISERAVRFSSTILAMSYAKMNIKISSWVL